MNTAIYNVTPAQAEQMLGRPVGPNHLGEFFQVVDYDPITVGTVEKFDGTVIREDVSGCRLIFAPMTNESKAMVSEEHRRDFIVLVDKVIREHPMGVPEWQSSVWKMDSGLKIRMAERSKLTAAVPFQ